MRESPARSDRDIARQLDVGNKTVSRWRIEADMSRSLDVPSLTTCEVIARAAEGGARLTPRRLRRWMGAGLLPEWAGARVFPGKGSVTVWWPGVVEQALEIDRLMRDGCTSRDVLLSLVASGYEIDA